jgi:hypothetical protein
VSQENNNTNNNKKQKQQQQQKQTTCNQELLLKRSIDRYSELQVRNGRQLHNFRDNQLASLHCLPVQHWVVLYGQLVEIDQAAFLTDTDDFGGA